MVNATRYQAFFRLDEAVEGIGRTGSENRPQHFAPSEPHVARAESACRRTHPEARLSAAANSAPPRASSATLA